MKTCWVLSEGTDENREVLSVYADQAKADAESLKLQNAFAEKRAQCEKDEMYFFPFDFHYCIEEVNFFE